MKLTKHTTWSVIKSVVRIIGLMMIPFNLFYAILILVIAEIFGIIEEVDV